MQHLSTALLFLAAVVVVVDGASGQFYQYEGADQVATEAKNRAVTVIDGPKYVAPPPTPPPPSPPSPAPPANHTPPHPPPDKQSKPKYVELSRIYIGQLQNLPLRNTYPKQVKIHSPSSVYKYHKVVPLHAHRGGPYKQPPLVFAASTSKPAIVTKSPKFSLPVETINGIRADFVRPPHFVNTTTTSTTTAATTTRKYLRTKRIWPKHVLEKISPGNTTDAPAVKVAESKPETHSRNTTSAHVSGDLSSSGSHHKIIIVEGGRPPYRPVTRQPSRRRPAASSTSAPLHVEPNDWVPIVPSHYSIKKVRKSKQTPISSRRSDRTEGYLFDPDENPRPNNRMMYLQSFGLVPVASAPAAAAAPADRKNVIYFGKTRHLKPHVYSGYRGKPVVHTTHISGDHQTDESNDLPKYVTKIKHHHHHHHHRYVKTVEKPVKVEVPKPVPVPVPMPVPVKVEHKVPYPVPVKVPHPVPVKVVEKVKEYVPKPYPVVQQVPVYKHVEVKVPQPVEVEKKVPVPYQVEVPRPYPVAVHVEKKVPYPVPVRVLVPQPYPVEKRVPVPVKEPVEVIKHVAVRVPVPQPYPVRVPQPYPVEVEKRVPYPVEVEKKVTVPVPYRVLVPKRVEVEKRVPVFVPRPYPVEKRVPVPVKVPYPVRVPIRVPVGIPIMVHPPPENGEQLIGNEIPYQDDGSSVIGQQHLQYSYSVQDGISQFNGNDVTEGPHQTVTYHGNTVTRTPHSTVTVHGKPGFDGFQSRSDTVDETTTVHTTSDFTTSAAEVTTVNTHTTLTTTAIDTPTTKHNDTNTDAPATTTPTLDPR